MDNRELRWLSLTFKAMTNIVDFLTFEEICVYNMSIKNSSFSSVAVKSIHHLIEKNK